MALPVSVPISVPTDRSLCETLRRVETVVWSVCTVATLVLLVASVGGAFVVAASPLTPSAAALLASVVVGSLVFVAADVVFE
ncbi:hypothetical protein [Salinigranum halophilum]|jgi:hypothetical protein|uniref:hypothetical protein n=1 Tax=Salinigranum halophilum TaxID=2565931 RepID=UPI00115D04E0|nr:hypothetical protein [Salinigranum halophilum]